MMNVLLEACPAFNPRWKQLLDEWKHEPDDPPLYVALADYVRNLTAMLKQEDVETFPAIFQAIEKLHVEGDAYVQEAATIGILESMQSLDEANRFEMHLGPVSRIWWNKLNRFWDGDATALQE